MGIYNDVTILVNSCDLYEDAWVPFFTILKAQWPDCVNYRIVLNTETKTFDCDFLNIQTINSVENLDWSKRLRLCLEKIDSDYILFFLEDFFLMTPVDNTIFGCAYEYMKNHKNVGVINFKSHVDWIKKGSYGEFFTCVKRRTKKYRISTLTGLWRKTFLLKCLRDGEDPWEFEKYANIRAKLYKETVLCRKEEVHPVFLYYLLESLGYGISKRKWLPKNRELFNQYGLQVDFEKLGWYEYNQIEKIEKRQRRSKKELLQLLYKHPIELFVIIHRKVNMKNRFKELVKIISHVF